MRGIEFVTLSVLLLSAQQLASGSPAPSAGLAESLLTGLSNGLATAASKSSSAALEAQLRSALDAAGCSKSAVELFKMSSGEACVNVFQATVSYQQFLLDTLSFLKGTFAYADYSCFYNEASYMRNLKCYLDGLNRIGKKPLFYQFKALVDDVNSSADLYRDNYKRCIEQESSVKYSIGGEDFTSLASLVEKHCPAGTSVDSLKQFK